MENSSIDSGVETTNSESKIPTILAIAAFALAGLSFVFAWNTKSGLNRQRETMKAEIEEAVETAKQALADVRNTGTGGEDVSAIKTDVEELSIKLLAEYDKIAKSQTLVVNNQKQLNERIARLESRPAGGSSGSAPVAAQPANAGGSNAAATTNGKYRVQKGDYPAKIAEKLGISTKALMDANPGLDPTKLQINQEINVPQSR